MNRRGRVGRAVAGLVGLGLVAAGCWGPVADENVDGWAIGDRISDCTDRADDIECGPYLTPALAVLGGAPARQPAWRCLSVAMTSDGARSRSARSTRA